jgi:hypothetical protein
VREEEGIGKVDCTRGGGNRKGRLYAGMRESERQTVRGEEGIGKAERGMAERGMADYYCSLNK